MQASLSSSESSEEESLSDAAASALTHLQRTPAPVNVLYEQPIEFFMGHAQLIPHASELYKGKMKLSDDDKTFKLLQNIKQNSVTELQPFYHYLLDFTLSVSDGALSEYMMGYTIDYLDKHTRSFFKEYESMDAANQGLKSWKHFARYTAYDLYTYQNGGMNEATFSKKLYQNCQSCNEEIKQRIHTFLFDARNIALLEGLIEPMSSKEQLNVVDYYQGLYKQGIISYPLVEKNAGWVSKNDLDDEIRPIVDLRYGYIKIVDEGTGGGTIIQEVVLFRKKDKSPLMAVSLGEFDGIGESGRISFWELEGTYWQEITAKVFPSFKLEDFVQAEQRSTITEEDKEAVSIDLVFELPRKGTDIVVRPSLERWKVACKQQQEETACQWLERINKNPVIFKWDKTATQFIR